MNLSDERIAIIAKQISELLLQEHLVECKAPASMIATIQKAMIRYVQADTAIDEKVRAKIGTLKRTVLEGSHEWDLLYQQYYEQELTRLG